MYPSRGHTVKLVDAARLPLTEAIRELLGMGDARLVYYAPDGAVFYIEVESRGRAGCIMVQGPRRLEGRQCLEELRRRLPGDRGTIELIRLDPERVRTDFYTFIGSLLPLGRRELEQLIGAAGAQGPVAAPSPAALRPEARRPAAPAPAAAPPAQRPAAMTGAAAVVASPVVAAFRANIASRGLRLGELFDPLEAGFIVTVGREVEAAAPGRSCLEILQDVGLLAKHILVDCRGGGGRVVSVTDRERGEVQILYMDEETGRASVGEEALEPASRLTSTSVRVFVY